MITDIKMGLFSAKAYEIYGGVYYSTPSGEVILVTAIASYKDIDQYLWSDRIVLGEVKDFIKDAWKP